MSDHDYVYQEPTERPGMPDLLPEDDYDYIVAGLNGTVYTSNAGNVVLPIKLLVGPARASIWDYPNAGRTKQGNPYDQIAGFLKSCGKNPKPGQKPDLSEDNLKGARGRCHVQVEVAEAGSMKGKEVNRIQYYIYDDKGGSKHPAPVPKNSPTVVRKPDVEPDDIPF
jgi:hypothetical protein